MMDRLIDRQLKNIEKAYESIPMGGKLEFSKSAVESLHQVLVKIKEYQDLGLEPSQLKEISPMYQSKCEEVVKLTKEVAEYQQKLADGRMVEIPCKVGDTVYILAECENIEKHLDGTYYDSDGGPGTATGYYCPYEDNCPHMESDDDCEQCEDKTAIFEDYVSSINIDYEIGILIYTKNCRVSGRFGENIFYTHMEAEQALKESNRKQNENPCINSGCDCYNSEVGGCEMPSEDLMFACPLERGDK